MANVLVVANETLGGRALIDAVKARAEGGEAHFVVVSPENRPRAGLVVYRESARSAAENRVQATVEALREEGIDARGDVMDPDPYNAVMDAVGEYAIDEIIISTHPETRSGWLRRDLLERVRADSGLPVEHVIVDLDADREDGGSTLVVANQTMTGEELHDALRAKAEQGPHRFTLIVPQSGGEGGAAAAARERLETMLERLRREGFTATGGIGDPDPYTAIMNALQFYRVDNIVISTLPEQRSGWLRSDLVERVQRATACPVEHVVVEPDPARSGA